MKDDQFNDIKVRECRECKEAICETIQENSDSEHFRESQNSMSKEENSENSYLCRSTSTSDSD